MVKKLNAAERKELLKYIVDNINDLPIKDRKAVLNIIAIDIPRENITNSMDGCRMIIDELDNPTILDIIDFMNIVQK